MNDRHIDAKLNRITREHEDIVDPGDRSNPFLRACLLVWLDHNLWCKFTR
ncbi:MAG: hypothetical protein F6K32_25215 [Desertifilum sp. SIO1I2]|nr:hypothetical protein [Desertifilum sp. SIO1I2]